MTSSPSTLTVVAAAEGDRPVLEQLWTMFRHDMSAFTGSLPDRRGRFRQERLDAALTDPGWTAHLFRLGQLPSGSLWCEVSARTNGSSAASSLRTVRDVRGWVGQPFGT